MKKLAVVALAAVLSFGCVAPAFAAGPHHGAGRCSSYAGICRDVTQSAIAPGLQSLHDRLSAMFAQANGSWNGNGNGIQGAGVGYGGGAASGVDVNATSPSLCANGACGLYLDADNDGICDYHGENCTNMGSTYVDADGDGMCDNYGTNRQGSGMGAGGHHGSGHHGGYHH